MAATSGIFVGTAGWSVPKVHGAHFPAEGSHLARYASVFSCAEINSSFYRPHRRSTYERWAGSTPDGFLFSVKAPKTVTHEPGFSAADLDEFFADIAGLQQKLGPILVQLPPKRRFDADDAAHLLRAFRARTEGPLVLEPRHPSWFAEDVEEMLAGLRIARVAADPPRAEGADRPGGWAGLAYFRLHGSPVVYRSSYDDGRLDGIARTLRAAARTGAQTWCVFDNTSAYAAAGDALALRARLGT